MVLTTSFGVAIFGGMRPPSWRRMRDACMVIVLVTVRGVSGYSLAVFNTVWFDVTLIVTAAISNNSP